MVLTVLQFYLFSPRHRCRAREYFHDGHMRVNSTRQFSLEISFLTITNAKSTRKLAKKISKVWPKEKRIGICNGGLIDQTCLGGLY